MKSTVKSPSMVIRAVSAFQSALFEAAYKHAESQYQADSIIDTIKALIAKQYGKVAPTYAQYRADHQALTQLAAHRGLVDNQHVRKPYNKALKAVFGALPVSDSPAAKAKALQRAKTAKPAKNATKAGKTIEQPATTADTIGQVIAKFGPAAVLAELAKILAAEKSSALDAKTLQAVAAHYQ